MHCQIIPQIVSCAANDGNDKQPVVKEVQKICHVYIIMSKGGVKRDIHCRIDGTFEIRKDNKFFLS